MNAGAPAGDPRAMAGTRKRLWFARITAGVIQLISPNRFCSGADLIGRTLLSS